MRKHFSMRPMPLDASDNSIMGMGVNDNDDLLLMHQQQEQKHLLQQQQQQQQKVQQQPQALLIPLQTDSIQLHYPPLVHQSQSILDQHALNASSNANSIVTSNPITGSTMTGNVTANNTNTTSAAATNAFIPRITTQLPHPIAFATASSLKGNFINPLKTELYQNHQLLHDVTDMNQLLIPHPLALQTPVNFTIPVPVRGFPINAITTTTTLHPYIGGNDWYLQNMISPTRIYATHALEQSFPSQTAETMLFQLQQQQQQQQTNHQQQQQMKHPQIQQQKQHQTNESKHHHHHQHEHATKKRKIVKHNKPSERPTSLVVEAVVTTQSAVTTTAAPTTTSTVTPTVTTPPPSENETMTINNSNSNNDSTNNESGNVDVQKDTQLNASTVTAAATPADGLQSPTSPSTSPTNRGERVFIPHYRSACVACYDEKVKCTPSGQVDENGIPGPCERCIIKKRVCEKVLERKRGRKSKRELEASLNVTS